jgi:SAM-dependent methyltransferase
MADATSNPSSTRSVEQMEYDKRWSSTTEGYGDGQPGYAPNFLKFMDQWIPKAPGKPPKALDVGCGDGYFTTELARRGCDATGVDFSITGLSTAQKRASNAKFMEHDLSKGIPFPDSTFDLVWCSEVLEHLFSPLTTINEIKRVLRPGGLFLTTVPYHDVVKNVAIALFAFEKHYDPTYPHIRYFTRKSLGSLLRQADLEVLHEGKCGSNLGLRDVIFPTNLLMVSRKRA